MPKKLKAKKTSVIFVRNVICNEYHFFCDGVNIGRIRLTVTPSISYQAFSNKITKSKRCKDYREGVIWLYQQHSGRRLKKPIIIDTLGNPL